MCCALELNILLTLWALRFSVSSWFRTVWCRLWARFSVRLVLVFVAVLLVGLFRVVFRLWVTVLVWVVLVVDRVVLLLVVGVLLMGMFRLVSCVRVIGIQCLPGNAVRQPWHVLVALWWTVSRYSNLLLVSVVGVGGVTGCAAFGSVAVLGKVGVIMIGVRRVVVLLVARTVV